MPEELTEEQTRAAFALMRAEDLTYIRPPGSAEALRAVRRRRRTRAAVVAAGVVIAVAGGATVAALVDTDRTALPPATPSPSPSALPRAQLNELGDAAAIALGVRYDSKKRKLAGEPQIFSGSSGPIRDYIGVAQEASGAKKYGDFVFEVLCLGEGTIHAKVWAAAQGVWNTAPPSDAIDRQVTCSDKPTPIKVNVRAPKPKIVYFVIQGDPVAVGRAACATLIREP